MFDALLAAIEVRMGVDQLICLGAAIIGGLGRFRGASVVVLDTSTRRGLVDSAYNERVAQCQTAARHFGVPALRDISMEQFSRDSEGLEPTALRRARHVISEDERTLAAVQAMKAGDAAKLGRLMNASHVSLRDDFDVSSDELNAMVEIAQAQPACLGARMTGAGFGGCAVALVQEDGVDAFVSAVAPAYAARTNYQASLYVCRATDGASVQAV